ncbi:MAG: (E)-4-hydroxy-3-methylbut-2-enyl-diphosphate synthase [Spirochaetaceae bacterium]|nr:(E)-4-hydroxy-3-methylbut-2-enyl-diphosphate synthase [Spirochaetaceae bacterium]
MAGGPSLGPGEADVRALDGVLGDPFRPRRRPTRVVRVGDVAIGGDEPIRLQSMTNTDTMDTAATVAQIERLAAVGCEIVRVTAPSIREAENLREIKRVLGERGVHVPLVADIHFTPNAAMIAAGLVEKVRINPGNYADKKKFEVREYDDTQYAAEIERVAERFRPLVRRCRENGVAMRIGTNHGSLSDRILNRFGDTAEGMVESALEFLDVCEDEAYRDVVFSMKASNTQVAIQAYRLLAARLERRRPGEPSYPFHVGVTEAGDAEDGRIKSAIGIGALLEDGLGDTIRVSLTEDPVREIPVARAIAARAEAIWRGRSLEGGSEVVRLRSRAAADPFAHVRRASTTTKWGALELGGEAPVRVELDLPGGADVDPEVMAAQLTTELSSLRDVACESLLVRLDAGDGAADWLVRLATGLASLGADWPISVEVAAEDAAFWTHGPPALAGTGRGGRVVVRVDESTPVDRLAVVAERAARHRLAVEWSLDAPGPAIPACVARLVASTEVASIGLRPEATLHDHRVLAAALHEASARDWPIVLHQAVARDPELGLIDASVRLGGLLCDGIGDVVSMGCAGAKGAAAAVDLAYRVLQGARQRTTRTEYISCPSCGRTLFDLEETTARIKARTAHLSGVKIAVMGCIVNGPGEMADADFGYVGSGVGQVTLYVGQHVVARAVPEAQAPDRLVELIRDHGRWRETSDGPEPA